MAKKMPFIKVWLINPTRDSLASMMADHRHVMGWRKNKWISMYHVGETRER